MFVVIKVGLFDWNIDTGVDKVKTLIQRRLQPFSNAFDAIVVHVWRTIFFGRIGRRAFLTSLLLHFDNWQQLVLLTNRLKTVVVYVHQVIRSLSPRH